MTGAVYLLDKQSGVTSRKAAGIVSRANGFRKYGHCGTLDPDATGLLVVLLGKATRLASYIAGEWKRYSFSLVTGVHTDTLDMSGEILEEADNSKITTGSVKAVLNQFTGIFMQQAPLFSAVRVNGKRGYHLARQGKKPDMPEREVSVLDWQAGEMNQGRITLEATVSSGTYIRALARDIGKAVGVPAVADHIRRTRSGEFSVEEASTEPDAPASLLSMSDALRGYPRVVLDRQQCKRIIHGMSVEGLEEGLVALVNHRGDLVSIGTGAQGVIKPRVVVAGEEIL